jgi:hypothetical protein
VICREKLKDDYIAWIGEGCIRVVVVAIAADGNGVDGWC